MNIFSNSEVRGSFQNVGKKKPLTNEMDLPAHTVGL